MVSDISMDRLVLIFTKGLVEPLRCLVKSQSSYIEGCHEFDKRFTECVSKNQIPPKHNFLSKFKEGNKPWQNDSFSKENKGGQAKKNLEERSYVSHANNLGF